MFTTDSLSDEEWRSLSWTAQDVDPTLVMFLDEMPPAADAFDQLERIGTWEKVIAWAQARQCAEIAGFVADSVAAPSHGMTAEQAAQSAEAEIGLMLTLAPGGAAWRVSDAQTLVECFPATFAALGSGAITLTKARIIADGCADVSPEIAAAVEARVLPRAPRQTHGQLRSAVARAVKREDAAASERRRERKKRDRKVVLYPERDGMATLSATLPAAEAVGVFAVLDEFARAAGSADGRPMDARRADALTDLVLGGTGFCSGAAAGDGSGAGENPSAGPDPAADTAASDTAASGDGDPLVLPVAPAPSRLPGIAPGCGTRTATTTVSIQIRVIVPLDSCAVTATSPPSWPGTGRSPPPRRGNWLPTRQARGGGWSPTRSPAASSTTAPPDTGPHPTWPNA